MKCVLGPSDVRCTGDTEITTWAVGGPSGTGVLGFYLDQYNCQEACLENEECAAINVEDGPVCRFFLRTGLVMNPIPPLSSALPSTLQSSSTQMCHIRTAEIGQVRSKCKNSKENVELTYHGNTGNTQEWSMQGIDTGCAYTG